MTSTALGQTTCVPPGLEEPARLPRAPSGGTNPSEDRSKVAAAQPNLKLCSFGRGVGGLELSFGEKKTGFCALIRGTCRHLSSLNLKPEGNGLRPPSRLTPQCTTLTVFFPCQIPGRVGTAAQGASPCKVARPGVELGQCKRVSKFNLRGKVENQIQSIFLFN